MIATPPADPPRARQAGAAKPASTCSSRSRWRRAWRTPTSSPRSPRADDRVLMPGHTFIYSPAVNTVRDLIRERRRRRRALRHLLADEPRQVQRRRRRLRPGARTTSRSSCTGSSSRSSKSPPPGSSVLQPGRARDGLHDAHLRQRPDGQRADLLAGAAQGPPDDRRRQPADGPVRRHRLRRTGADLRPRHGHAARRRRPTSASTS